VSAIPNLTQLTRMPFDDVPREWRRRVYRVPYAQVDDSTGGRLWITRHGWSLLAHLDPSEWFLDDAYHKRGAHLSGGSGSVYRVPTRGKVPRGLDLVVKFSRMAQDVPLHVSSQFPHDVPRHVIDSASFNDPFQEFGFVTELRSSEFDPASPRVLTKRPLAIYAPGQVYAPWQLGRTESRFQRHQYLLAQDQRSVDGEPPVDMLFDRRYVYLYHWVSGIDAETLHRDGTLSSSDTAKLVNRVIVDLAARGFRMLDVKPAHIILRTRPDGTLLRRRGELAYVLVDFELLQRTEAYQQWLKQQLVVV